MADNTKNGDLKDRVAVNQAGRIGQIQKTGTHRQNGSVAYFGTGMDGKPWRATSISLIDAAEGRRILALFTPATREATDWLSEISGGIFSTGEIAKAAEEIFSLGKPPAK